MTQKFEQTNIPEDLAKDLAQDNYTIGAVHLPKVLKVIMTGASKLLGSVKVIDKPMAIAFRKVDGSFIAGAKVEFHKNPDNPEDISAGNWSYIWTFYEKDLEGASIVNINNDTGFTHFITAASKLYHMNFHDNASALEMFNRLLDYISHWLDDNAKEGEEQILVSDGSMTAACTVKDGVVVKSIVPDGEVKVLIKGDDMYQDDVA